MRIIFFFFAAVLFSCTYEPVEENFVRLNQDTPEFSISLHELDNEDTITLYQNANFSYDFSANKGNLLKVEVLINNDLIYSSNSPSGSFHVTAEYIGTGTHQMKIQFQTTSGTGSLVDKLGGEQLQVWKSWVLKIDVSPPPNPNLRFSIQQGFLNIDWDAYTKPNFSQFRLSYLEYGIYRQVTITDPKKTSWVDSTFLVGQRDYTIEVTTNLKSSFWYKSYTAPGFNCQTVHNPADSTITATWNSTPLYGTLKKAEVYEGGSLKYTIADPAETTAKIKISKSGFLVTASMSIKLYARNTASSVYQMGGTAHVTIPGTKINPLYTTLLFNKGTNRMYAKRYDQNSNMILVSLDNNFKGVDSVSLNYSTRVPFNESIAYYGGNNSDVILYDLTTRQTSTVALYNLDHEPGIFNPGVLYLSPTQYPTYSASGNIACYNFYTHSVIANDPFIYYFRVYNTSTQKVLYTATKTYSRLTTNPFGGLLSENGKFIKLSDNKLYKITDTNIQEVPNHVFPGTFAGFKIDNGSEFFVDNGAQLDVYDCNTNTKVKTVSLQGYYYVNYDAATRSVQFESPASNDVGERKIASYDTGLVLKTIIVSDSYGYGLFNGYLLSQGRFLKVF